MKVLFALVLGMAVGAGAAWFYLSSCGQPGLASPSRQLEHAARSAGDMVEEQLRAFNLSPAIITNELARTGRVLRQKAAAAGQAVADATADARITAAIKAKLLQHPDLSAWSISVNTTAGTVTLSGFVSSAENIGKAVLVAIETDGVREVISTLQVQR
jgi:hypothetical protein